eukprot:COSAG01_NODE_60504_length_294_cov_1.051282_1_plen_36_part_01
MPMLTPLVTARTRYLPVMLGCMLLHKKEWERGEQQP